MKKSVEGWLTSAEGLFLYQTAKKVKPGRVIVEIGSWKGKSTICLARGSKEGKQAKIYAIDPHLGSSEQQKRLGKIDTFKEFKQNIRQAGVTDYVKPLKTTSLKAAKKVHQPVEFVFIDGAHEYKFARLDFKLWFPKVVNGGILAFHDSTSWCVPGPNFATIIPLLSSSQVRRPRLVDTITYFEKVNCNSLFDRLKNIVFIIYRTLLSLRGLLKDCLNNQLNQVLLLHYEYRREYLNKNIGYFIQTCLQNGYRVKFICQKIIDNRLKLNHFKVIVVKNNWRNLFQVYHRVWLYPFEKPLILKMLILKLFANKIIIKMDSGIVPVWRAKLINALAYRVLVESPAVARPFNGSKKLVNFNGGLSQENIDLINQLKVNRQKQILYSGRQTYQKGIDRMAKLSFPGWRIKIVSDLSGKNYYREILRSSLVILPTRGEGWPNVFSDAFFCRRLFLTTTGAQCQEAILNQDFYCPNNIPGIRQALKKILSNLSWYYQNYDKHYDSTKFVVADKTFLSLIVNQG